MNKIQLSIQTKYILFGIVFGLFFPVAAWTLDIINSNDTFSASSIIKIHKNNVLHYIIDLAPFVLGPVFYFLGKDYQGLLKRHYFSSLLAENRTTDSPLKFKIIISFILLLILLFIGTYSWYIQRTITFKSHEEIGKSLDTILTTTEQAVFFRLKEQQSHALIWARTKNIIQGAQELLPLQDSRQKLISSPTQENLRKWFDPIQKVRAYQGFFIISTAGISLASSRDINTGEINLLTHQPGFLKEIWQGKTTLSSPHHAQVALLNQKGKLTKGLVTMFVGAPIKDESEKIIAALAFRLDPHIELSPILQQGRIGDSGETYAFIKEGEMITQSRFEQSLEKHGVTVVDTTGIIHLEVRNPGVNLTQGKQANISRKQQPFTRMAKSAMTGESGQDLEGYRDYRGVPVIGSWLWSERLGFGMTTEIDVVEAYSMLNFNRRIIFISAFILGLLTLGFFAFLIKYLNQSRKSARILIENEQTMRLLLNSTGEAIYGIDLNGECTFANKTCLNLLGYQSEDKLLSKNMHDVIHHTRKDGRLYPVEECKIINAFHNGKESHVDDEVLWRMDGSCFPVEYRSIPILSAGKAIGSVVSFSDITARLDAEEKEQDRFNKLIRYKNAMAEIVRFSETIAKGVGIESIQKRILKTLAIALDVARTSIWFYSDDHNSIVLSNLFKKSEDAYESGRVLNSKDYPNYFSALAEDTIIAADDAMIDPHTCEFKDSYLKSLGITSMIHVPIRIKGRTVGAICIEHTGKMRQWDLYEQEFTTSVSISLALVIESNERTKSEARHKMVLETMIDGLITINKAGMIESFNPAAEEIFGYSAEEVIGKDIILLMPESYRSGHHQSLDRHNKTGEVHILGKTGIEVEGLRKNGSIFPIAISISEMFIGGQHHYSGVMRDITERKVLEHERERATEELTQLIDTANAPIFGIDTQGRVNEWNQQAAKISGYSKAEVVGQDLVKGFITEEYKKPVKDILDDALQGKETANYEFPLYTKDGNRIDILLNATTRRDTLGNITGVIGVGQDITELRIKEHALNQAQKMEAVGQLTGGIAHDFNNLLSIISGNLSFLQQDIGSTTVEINELFEDAMSAVNDGAELTQRLLAFSSSRTLQPENKNVNYVIQKFARFLKRTLGEKIELIIDLPIESLFISVDPSQLDNALLNLSINARDAMPQGGIITIAAARYHFTDTDTDTDDNYELSLSVGDYILISVVDTGSGINSDDLEHVFEPFFTTKELGKGSGLGLSMVYGFTRQSRGGCHIRSTLGKGTTVSMFFPEVDAVRDIDKKTKEHEYLSMYGSEVILVVEDEPRVRKVVLRDLKKLGYKTLEADNAELAITIIKSGAHIDLLFSDVLMPGTMDGYMLAKWTKEHYPYIKVVLTSGYSKGKSDLSEDRIRLFPLIRKPYTIDKLAKLIRAALTE